MSRRSLGAIVIATVAALAAAGCGPGSPAPTSPTPSVVTIPTETSSSGTTVATPTARPPNTAQPTVRSSTAPTVVVDPALLLVLPVSVDGVALDPDPVTAASIAADPTLALNASAIALARVVASDASAGDDLAIVSVVRLRPGVFDAAFFTSWRSSYDAAACASAGGVGSSSAAVIGGTPGFADGCVGGAATYHVHLPGDVLVSVTAVGGRDLGRRVIEGLRG